MSWPQLTPASREGYTSAFLLIHTSGLSEPWRATWHYRLSLPALVKASSAFLPGGCCPPAVSQRTYLVPTYAGGPHPTLVPKALGRRLGLEGSRFSWRQPFHLRSWPSDLPLLSSSTPHLSTVFVPAHPRRENAWDEENGSFIPRI